MNTQIFQKGIRRMAEPKDQLQKRYQQFQRRMARHFLNQSEAQQYADQTADAPATSRSSDSRQVLGKLSNSQAVSGHRLTSSTAHSHSALPLSSRPTSSSTTSTHNKPPSLHSTTGSTRSGLGNKQPSIAVFEDPPASDPSSSSEPYEPYSNLLIPGPAVTWQSVPLASTLKKENEGKYIVFFSVH